MCAFKLKEVAKDVKLTVNLSPKRQLSSSARGRLWQKLLDPDFRTSLGEVRIDHISSGGSGESHVEYLLDGIDALITDRGHTDVDLTKLIPERTRQLEKMLSSVIAEVGRAARKKVDLNLNGLLHLMLVKPVMTRFMAENIRFVASPEFFRVFRNKGVKSFLLRLSDTLDVVVGTRGHLDFLYHDTISTTSNRKPFVGRFLTLSTRYIESLRRRAS
jgi:hypothetical protein